ncbi:hypothetical protein CU102_03220 [Phyllobacterium brassicacearum]|uniref:Uncharacterized protein n=1 Tax=Phyllobacterium brassicacearum TaxID=314235 RepID=A0A2P7BUG9_9HYPH|nr:hypothetical protein [Phyllobacterium brassicacearum]PSH70123.1 hypothetical protein CU102_03220 [Phyllobacterium brassicacearum]TDQ34007.1 hypothetical protein DEV91_104210 [Phyllobacterium brassicacearum]
MTGADRAAIISEITGKPLRFTVLDEAQLRLSLPQAGVPDRYIDSLIDIEKHFLAGSFNIVTGDVERISGRPPQRLREVLLQQLA